MTEELKQKLIDLLGTHEELFEEIEVDWDEFDPEDSEAFFADGEASLLEAEGKTYRFFLDDVAEFVGDEVYEL
ncbi:hypothetical protein LC607_18020 [Nostoc sp. CHAB 5824]|nr:hypothetical protein [Nostoc sp. CHAB 5824]